MAQMREPEFDPIMEEWMNLPQREVLGNTPEEKLENFMAYLSREPADIQKIMREVMAEEFGVTKGPTKPTE